MNTPELVPPVVFKVTEEPWQMEVSEGLTITAEGEAFTVMVVVAVMIQPELVSPVVVSNAVTV